MLTPPGEDRKIENAELRVLIDRVEKLFDSRLTKTEQANDAAHEVIFNKLDKHNNFQGRLIALEKDNEDNVKACIPPRIDKIELYMKIAVVIFGVAGSVVSFIFYNLLAKLLDKITIAVK